MSCSCSHLFALNSKWMASSDKFELFFKYALIICPISLVRSGNRVKNIESFRSTIRSYIRLIWVDLPLRSTPSNMIRAPRTILDILGIKACFFCSFFRVYLFARTFLKNGAEYICKREII